MSLHIIAPKCSLLLQLLLPIGSFMSMVLPCAKAFGLLCVYSIKNMLHCPVLHTDLDIVIRLSSS